ncbi:MAG: sulfur reduction protein DsrE [Cyanobacteria bacterium QS_8_64_29]|nr:MAG: sulfur reduction protein DsrE [Cyanobacteria bacterium QS_8_64_29]
MQVVVAVSYGTDDPTKATLGMLAAKAAADRGHAVTVWLQGEGVAIANRHVYGTIQGLNMPAMKDVVEALIAAETPLWVCQACAQGRNITPDNWVSTATYKGMGDYVSAALAADKTLNF